MYTDFIQYTLADGVTEAQLQSIAADILESWMCKQPGFISWHIYKLPNDAGFIDTVQWESQAAAKAAEANMKDIPADSPWYACYNMESLSSKSGTRIFTS